MSEGQGKSFSAWILVGEIVALGGYSGEVRKSCPAERDSQKHDCVWYDAATCSKCDGPTLSDSFLIEDAVERRFPMKPNDQNKLVLRKSQFRLNKYLGSMCLPDIFCCLARENCFGGFTLLARYSSFSTPQGATWTMVINWTKPTAGLIRPIHTIVIGRGSFLSVQWESVVWSLGPRELAGWRLGKEEIFTTFKMSASIAATSRYQRGKRWGSMGNSSNTFENSKQKYGERVYI